MTLGNASSRCRGMALHKFAISLTRDPLYGNRDGASEVLLHLPSAARVTCQTCEHTAAAAGFCVPAP